MEEFRKRSQSVSLVRQPHVRVKSEEEILRTRNRTPVTIVAALTKTKLETTAPKPIKARKPEYGKTEEQIQIKKADDFKLNSKNKGLANVNWNIPSGKPDDIGKKGMSYSCQSLRKR